MRALLIVNPYATTYVSASGEILARALGQAVDLEVAVTTHRGHAGELAAEAGRRGFDLVVVHGGDGTINEAINGMVPAPTDPSAPIGPVPKLGVLPGGSANVFARSNGIPASPAKAAAQLARLIQAGEDRRVGLGWAEDRWFTFTAGLGFDAHVCELIDEQRSRGMSVTPLRYVRSAFRAFFAEDRAKPSLTVYRPGHPPVPDLFFAFVSNTSPWTYFGAVPVRTNATTRSNDGLGVFALRTMNLLPFLATAGQMLVRSGGPSTREVLRDDNVKSVRLSSTRPLPFQLDGDYLGTRSEIEFFAVPDTLTLVAPHKTAG